TKWHAPLKLTQNCEVPSSNPGEGAQPSNISIFQLS
ncbi:hypothetical protein A2U01_0052026, partial [Trifolium medium]|nr:hypothetical protein [Trifolium medium]